MEPIVAGGLVFGLTVTSLVFVGLCNAIADRLYNRFFARGEPEAEVRSLRAGEEPKRRSA